MSPGIIPGQVAVAPHHRHQFRSRHFSKRRPALDFTNIAAAEDAPADGAAGADGGERRMSWHSASPNPLPHTPTPVSKPPEASAPRPGLPQSAHPPEPAP